MGIYINPLGETKEAFLERHATPASETSPAKAGGQTLVCYVLNPGFSAAAICFNDEERDRFRHPSDVRAKYWFYVPDEALAPFITG